MTITQLIPLVKQLSASDKVKLIRILAEALDSDSDDIYPLDPNKTYNIPTPYDTFGAGKILMEALQTANQTIN